MKPKPFSALNHFTVPIAMPAAPKGTAPQGLRLTAGTGYPPGGSLLPLVPKLRFPAPGHKSRDGGNRDRRRAGCPHLAWGKPSGRPPPA
jgi:hypothetical protein